MATTSPVDFLVARIERHRTDAVRAGLKPEPFYLSTTEMIDFLQSPHVMMHPRTRAASSFTLRFRGVPLLEKPSR
jgi:hypothetical protein